ncbi:phosphatidylinositol/phosphatidylcholine transfer protein, putative [Paecilomyces variotii No. 5]|uniref:Phosphatidylinositol/phosphatidylcholine transfer protein, putative n=1 Tax=Byssochlamys spectabilis (strain No. 5 / NBRC 109023) TaxID=1356009 RepID=V5G5F9_BYSSN|nr:phosphatidylinositol/phosphatidylcholine transfer protein, putative [Paecilomyces variotii No. 5]
MIEHEVLQRHIQTTSLPRTLEDSTQLEVARMAQRACVHHDYLTRFILSLCSVVRNRPNLSKPVRKSVYIVDASSLWLKQAWDLREFAQDISWILSTCYPETIERIFSAEKVVVLRAADVYPTLSKYIDHDNIPTQFGGEFVFTNGMLPDLDDKMRQELHWVSPFNGTLPSGPIKWIRESPERMKAVATGSADGVQRGEIVAITDYNG